MLWHTFISHVFAHIYLKFLAHIYLSCFGTYLSLMFWHIFITNALAHIYLSCFGTYLSLMFWLIYL